MRTICFIALSFIFSSNCFAYAVLEDPRGAFISQLINESSGAQQVKKSNNPEVKESYQKAKQLLLLATEKFNQGDASEGSSLLDESATTMFKAIRLATPRELDNVKVKHDYDKRMDSVKALTDAFNRITAENYDHKIKLKVNKQLDKMLDSSNEFEKAGNYESAKIELDKAYMLLKQSMKSLRGGQTLVRSLNFASAEEEYNYELDRNNTHKMLIILLLDEEKSSAYTRKAVSKFRKEAESIRTQAEAAAQDKQFKQAVKLLEQSTKQLVRAIRSAGVYIPG